MSSNVLSSGGGGVAWQVDLPGLSSLLLNLGSAGLKRFAEAGVDFHTVLCMGEIAENCPASNQCRKELSICRQEQRRQSQWLYKIVEIGSATNFVADELLKRRAGENVVALLSAILPVMPESACDALILKLFEVSAAPLDKTPGFGQLRALRETLAPLARKTEFKDKVFQYHVLAKQLLEEDGVSLQVSASTAIPDDQTAAQVILLLAKLVQEDNDSILEYYGLSGAGWVIAYARHILGLPVCILKSSSHTVPISGDLVDSKVYVHIFEKSNKCQIVNKIHVQDLFVTKSLEAVVDNAWVVDAAKTSILDMHIPKSEALRKVAPSIAHSLACDFTHVIANSLSSSPQQTLASQAGFELYLSYCLPAIRDRVRRNLELLGFGALDGMATCTGSEHWSRYFEVKRFEKQDFQDHWQDDIMVDMTAEDFGPHLAAGPAWILHNLGETSSCKMHLRPKDGHKKEARITAKGTKYVCFLMQIVEAASWLAFTNWDQDLRILSTSFVEDLSTWRSGLNLYERYINQGPKGVFDSIPRTSIADLCKSAIDLVISGRQTWTPDFSGGKLLAFQHRTIVFQLNVALNQKFDIEASLLHFLPGTITTNGERQNKIYSYPTECEPKSVYTAPRVIQQRVCKPIDHFSSLSIMTQCRLSDDAVILQQHAVIGSDICSMPSPMSAVEALLNLYVTESCKHNYYDVLSFSKSDAIAGLYSEDYLRGRRVDDASSHSPLSGIDRSASPQSRTLFSKSNLQQGFYAAGTSEKFKPNEFWLQETDQNPAGQWLAHQTCGQKGYLTVLQRSCCLNCTCQKIEEVLKPIQLSQPDYQNVRIVRIVNGRLQGEAME